VVVDDGLLSAADTFSVCLPEGLVAQIALSALVRVFVCSFLLVCRDPSPRTLVVW